MEIRVARLLGENDQVDLAGVQLQGGVGAGHDFLAVLLLDVLTDRKHPHIGENGLRSENFDPSRLCRVVVARDADDVNAVVGQDEPAGRGISAVVDLDRDRSQMADMKPPPSPGLTSLSRRIGSPRISPTRVIEPLTSFIAFASPDLVIINSDSAAFGQDCQATALSLTTIPIGRFCRATNT